MAATTRPASSANPRRRRTRSRRWPRPRTSTSRRTASLWAACRTSTRLRPRAARAVWAGAGRAHAENAAGRFQGRRLLRLHKAASARYAVAALDGVARAPTAARQPAKRGAPGAAAPPPPPPPPGPPPAASRDSHAMDRVAEMARRMERDQDGERRRPRPAPRRQVRPTGTTAPAHSTTCTTSAAATSAAATIGTTGTATVGTNHRSAAVRL